MKIYLDDMRQAPIGWTLVKTAQEALIALSTEKVTHISLDHDLGDDESGTGYDVILWIEREVIINGFVPPGIKIHTANISARKKMEMGLKSIITHASGNKILGRNEQ